jgi:tRNA G46 methylase TrmB
MKAKFLKRRITNKYDEETGKRIIQGIFVVTTDIEDYLENTPEAQVRYADEEETQPLFFKRIHGLDHPTTITLEWSEQYNRYTSPELSAHWEEIEMAKAFA